MTTKRKIRKRSERKRAPRVPRVVDLFCGIGGLSHGFLRQNIDVVAGVDIDESCRYAYEQNNNAQFVCKSITNLTGAALRKLYPPNSFKILVGCAPCQPFSSHANKNRQEKKDKRWNLLKEFLRVVDELRPDVVSMENVPQLRKYDIFEEFVEGLEKLKYNVEYSVVYCPNYGIPQNRKRLVLLASKSRRQKIALRPPTHNPNSFVTVAESIANLPPIAAGEHNAEDPLHYAGNLTPVNLERIIASVPGGTWEDWPEHLVLPCHRRESGQTYKSVYGRMEWNKPSPTITTQFYNYGTGRFGHPEQNRALTLREGAMLQTFPPQYELLEPGREVSLTELARQIGNAVPVRLGEIIAQSIQTHFRALQR